MSPDEMLALAQSATLKWADLFVNVDDLATEWLANFNHHTADDFGAALSMLAYDGARRAKVPTVLELRQALEQVKLADRPTPKPTAICDGTRWLAVEETGQFRPCPACNPVLAGHPWTGPLPKPCAQADAVSHPGALWASNLADAIEEGRRQGALLGDQDSRRRHAAYRAGLAPNRHGLLPGEPKPVGAGMDELVARLRARAVELPVVPERKDVDG